MGRVLNLVFRILSLPPSRKYYFLEAFRGRNREDPGNEIVACCHSMTSWSEISRQMKYAKGSAWLLGCRVVSLLRRRGCCHRWLLITPLLLAQNTKHKTQGNYYSVFIAWDCRCISRWRHMARKGQGRGILQMTTDMTWRKWWEERKWALWMTMRQWWPSLRQR